MVVSASRGVPSGRATRSSDRKISRYQPPSGCGASPSLDTSSAARPLGNVRPHSPTVSRAYRNRPLNPNGENELYGKMPKLELPATPLRTLPRLLFWSG